MVQQLFNRNPGNAMGGSLGRQQPTAAPFAPSGGAADGITEDSRLSNGSRYQEPAFDPSGGRGVVPPRYPGEGQGGVLSADVMPGNPYQEPAYGGGAMPPRYPGEQEGGGLSTDGMTANPYQEPAFDPSGGRGVVPPRYPGEQEGGELSDGPGGWQPQGRGRGVNNFLSRFRKMTDNRRSGIGENMMSRWFGRRPMNEMGGQGRYANSRNNYQTFQGRGLR